MDRRTWLWRRKSSEKSPGETESSGSLSSHSGRFSDEQAYPTHSSLSQEVTSKVAVADDEVGEDVRTLSEKLSAALLNISAKEELVKQHAKVAEEAVSGWENAENEVLVLKKQLEAATQKNSMLEDRIGHLDGALKECVRQLRQVREEQEQKIQEAVVKKTREWELTKAELETKLSDVHAQLQAAKSEASSVISSDLGPKLDAAEKESVALKAKVLSLSEELEIRIIERDLSTQAAETASKQHLESIKKVARLEAECRRLRAMSRKATATNDIKSFSASSVCIESFTDSQSDVGDRLLAVENDMQKASCLEPNDCELGHSESWASALITELDHFKKDKSFGKNLMVSSGGIDLMDDFLEMERLAALPDAESGSCSQGVEPTLDQNRSDEVPLKSELEAMINRTAELEEELEKKEEEKEKLEMALNQCQKQLETSWSQLNEVEMRLVELDTMLSAAQKSKQAAEEEARITHERMEVTESRLMDVEEEMKKLLLNVKLLQEEVERERASSAENEAKYRKLGDENAENEAKCWKLEDENLKMKRDAELQHETELQRVAVSDDELKVKQEQELAVAASRFAECQKTISSLARQLKSLAAVDDFLIDSDLMCDHLDEGLPSPENELHHLNHPPVLISAEER
ncbi:filament-like plant protein 3 isoform X2 [Syzygium oleosum]|uniref:filament-like plant protein 3 isoform X2 n=1 Tax=Syzygium oleosum TaxID=219896 RepID=UPI0024BB0A69|nr:filament-like plant protein 3 isoform X2 [Syzygium oleosum]